MSTVETNKQEIETLKRQLADATKSRQELKDNQKCRKLPTRPPPIFKYGDKDFHIFAQSFKNYLLCMAVRSEDQIQVALTFICGKSYAMVTRNYPYEQLIATDYDIGMELISGILTLWGP